MEHLAIAQMTGVQLIVYQLKGPPYVLGAGGKGQTRMLFKEGHVVRLVGTPISQEPMAKHYGLVTGVDPRRHGHRALETGQVESLVNQNTMSELKGAYV